MAKKSKQPKNSQINDANSIPNPYPNSSNIFDTIFGAGTSQEASKDSLFSENNPFKRKPAKELEISIQRSRSSEESPNSEDANLKKMKKKKDKNQIHDHGSAQNDSGSLKDVNLNSNLAIEFNSELNKVEGHLGDLEIDGGEEKRSKKKRKRDELEVKYEVEHYGASENGEEEAVAVGEKRKKMDNPANMLGTKEEGFDDENKLLRTVFVGNLPLKVKKKSLLKEFGQYGEIESVRIRSVPIVNTKTPRKGAIMKRQINESVDSVHAYIVFKTEESAQASLAHNMAVVRGNHVRVDRACPPRKKLKGEDAPIYDNKRTVFVGNLPFDVKDEELYQLFCGIKQLESGIEAVRVIRDPNTSVGKGIAYVLFKTKEAANLVLKTHTLKLRDRDLRLSRAKADSTPSKRKNSVPSRTDNFPNKKLATDSRISPGSDNKLKVKPSLAYQGLRASKSGVEKKIHKIIEPTKFKPRAQNSEITKIRKTKRPAVAARKAKALRDDVASKQAGKKRKSESRTPESSYRKKKAKRSG